VGLWFQKPVLHPGETVRWKKAANREQNGWRAVGGRLFLTDSRLLFRPHRFDARLKGEDWAANLADIASVGTEEADGHPFSGGLRRRLCIDLADGTTERFVINQLETAVAMVAGSVQRG
jgi:hypothetical protein